jgi:DNA (cytosine-5)-methyltransferase 1
VTALLAPGSPSDGWALSPSGLHVPEGSARPWRPVAIDLFAGAGGFSVGFKQAGWHVAAAVEYERYAAATYLVNLGSTATVVHTDEHPEGRRCDSEVFHSVPGREYAAGTGWIASPGHEACEFHPHDPQDPPNGGLGCMRCGWRPEGCVCAPCVDPWPCEHFWVRDVTELTGGEIVDALGMRPGEVDAVIGGPPCQGYSIAGKRDVMDPRNSLVFEFARLVLEIRPKTFAMENVTGLLSMVTPEGIPVMDALARVFADGGFGTYDALRRSLRGMAGAAGAVRTDRMRQAPKQPESEDDEQPGLFELEPSS